MTARFAISDFLASALRFFTNPSESGGPTVPGPLALALLLSSTHDSSINLKIARTKEGSWILLLSIRKLHPPFVLLSARRLGIRVQGTIPQQNVTLILIDRGPRGTGHVIPNSLV